jgi:hypothetical protein
MGINGTYLRFSSFSRHGHRHTRGGVWPVGRASSNDGRSCQRKANVMRGPARSLLWNQRGEAAKEGGQCYKVRTTVLWGPMSLVLWSSASMLRWKSDDGTIGQYRAARNMWWCYQPFAAVLPAVLPATSHRPYFVRQGAGGAGRRHTSACYLGFFIQGKLGRYVKGYVSPATCGGSGLLIFCRLFWSFIAPNNTHTHDS